MKFIANEIQALVNFDLVSKLLVGKEEIPALLFLHCIASSLITQILSIIMAQCSITEFYVQGSFVDDKVTQAEYVLLTEHILLCLVL